MLVSGPTTAVLPVMRGLLVPRSKSRYIMLDTHARTAHGQNDAMTLCARSEYFAFSPLADIW
jgi:hypothetical protein